MANNQPEQNNEPPKFVLANTPTDLELSYKDIVNIHTSARDEKFDQLPRITMYCDFRKLFYQTDENGELVSDVNGEHTLLNFATLSEFKGAIETFTQKTMQDQWTGTTGKSVADVFRGEYMTKRYNFPAAVLDPVKIRDALTWPYDGKPENSDLFTPEQCGEIIEDWTTEILKATGNYYVIKDDADTYQLDEKSLSEGDAFGITVDAKEEGTATGYYNDTYQKFNIVLEHSLTANKGSDLKLWLEPPQDNEQIKDADVESAMGAYANDKNTDKAWTMVQTICQQPSSALSEYAKFFLIKDAFKPELDTNNTTNTDHVLKEAAADSSNQIDFSPLFHALFTSTYVAASGLSESDLQTILDQCPEPLKSSPELTAAIDNKDDSNGGSNP